jgi:hypothetical protein
MPQLAKYAADFILHVPVLDRSELSGPYDYKERQPDLEPTYGGDQSDSPPLWRRTRNVWASKGS